MNKMRHVCVKALRANSNRCALYSQLNAKSFIDRESWTGSMRHPWQTSGTTRDWIDVLTVVVLRMHVRWYKKAECWKYIMEVLSIRWR